MNDAIAARNELGLRISPEFNRGYEKQPAALKRVWSAVTAIMKVQTI
jgi:hypothetical protein